MQYNCLDRTQSLYIHWPFCPYRCHYCPFVALASHDNFMEQYHNALTTEIKCFAEKIDQKIDLNTIYFGGGTPSTYPDHLLLDTFGILGNTFTFNMSTEVTIEVNPGTIRVDQLKLWKEIGINRMSIGVQSLKDDVLQRLNRLQKKEDVLFVLEHAPRFFENISVDVILGLPGVTVKDWKELLQTVITWQIKHISMYVLEVHDNTPLFFNVKRKTVTLPPDQEVVDLYYWSRDFLQDHGFVHYEISSFAKPGFESQHNTVYWERKPYKGFGLGACSFDGTRRFQNEKSLMKYMEKIENDNDITVFAEKLTNEQIRLEKIMLGMRRPRGVLWNDMIQDLSSDKQLSVRKEIAYLKNNDLLKEGEGRLMLTPKGLVVENEIVSRLSL